MPTLDELGQKVKAKYPGVYDDMDDAAVGQKVQTKYPGAYADFKPASATPSVAPSDETPDDTAPAAPAAPHLGDEPNFLERVLAKAGTKATNWKELGQDVAGTALAPLEGEDKPLAQMRKNLPDQIPLGSTGEELAYNAAKSLPFVNPNAARAMVGTVEDAPGIAKGMLTPENAAWVGAAAVPVVGPPFVAAHFAKEGGQEAIAARQDYLAAKTDAERRAAMGRGAGGALMALGPLVHVGAEELRGRLSEAPRPEIPVEQAPTMPPEATAVEAPASAIPPVERRVGPQWNERGEDIRYQTERRNGGAGVPLEPELKIEPPVFEKGVSAYANDDIQSIREAHGAGLLTSEDLRRAGVRLEDGSPISEANEIPRGVDATENGPAGRLDAEAALDNAAGPREAPVPAEGERPADNAAPRGEEAAVAPPPGPEIEGRVSPTVAPPEPGGPPTALPPPPGPPRAVPEPTARPDNPFREKAIRAREHADALNRPTAHEQGMAEAFPLGAGFGRPGAAKRIDRSVNRAVEAVKATKDAEYLGARADAFDRGEISAQGRTEPRTQEGRDRLGKASEARASRKERIAVAQEQRAGKEPWEITQKVYADASGQLAGSGRRLVESDHREAVETALREGKAVPPEVIADYHTRKPFASESEGKPLTSRGATLGIKKIDAQMLTQATERATAEGNDYIQTLLKGLNPKKLTEGDRQMLNDYLGVPEGTMVKPGERVPEGPNGLPSPPKPITQSLGTAAAGATRNIEVVAYHGQRGPNDPGFSDPMFPRGGRIYPVHLAMKHPFVIDAKGAMAGDTQFGSKGKPFRDAIRSGKYDGVIIKNTKDEGTVYVALRPEQIKSAIGNKGTYDPENPSMVGAAAAGSIVPQQLSRVIAEKPNPFQRLATSVRENVSLGNMSDAAKGMAGLLRESNATGALEGIRATRNMKAALLALDKLSKPDQLDFYDKMEAGKEQPTPERQAFADTIRKELDKGTEHLKAGKHLDDFIENYMPHQYENEPIGAPFFSGRGGGKPGFLKERTYPTRADAVNAGLTPKFFNPAESAMRRLADQNRYLRTADAIQAGEKAGYITRYDANTAPPRLSPEGERIVRLDPKFNKMAGLEKGEYLSAPHSVAKILDTQMSKGLEGHPIYQAMRKVNNGINQIQLLSAFHASTSISNDFKSRLALGIQETLQGVLGEAGAQGRLSRTAQGIGHIVTSPAAPFLDFVSGKKMLKAAMEATDIPPDVKTALMGGHRFTMDREYATGATLAFQRALAQDKYGQAVLRAVPALLDQAMKPIMEHLVPALKTGAYIEGAKSELARLGPNATDAAKRYALGRLNDSLDNRMGQLTYDNGFWNKTAKNVGQVLLRSLGWNIGDLREGLGGAKDLATITTRLKGGEQVDPVVTHRMSYVAAEVIGSALVGSLYSYIKGATSDRPLPAKKEYKDYAFPKTGGFNKDKSPERFVPAGYMKEVYGYKEHPAETILGKASPLISSTWQLARGKDYFDKPFRNPQDPIWKEALDTMKYAGTQLTPLSTRQGMDNPRSKIGPFERQLGAPAPKYIYNPEAMNARDAAQYKRMNAKYLGGR